MQRVVSYLEDDIVKGLKELYKNSDKSMSKIISEIIDIGYKVKLHHKENQSNPQIEKRAELKEKHTVYLLRIMAIAADIYRCVRNDKSKYDEENVDDVLTTIASNTQNFINRKLGIGGGSS